jgi:hypothetical protein
VSLRSTKFLILLVTSCDQRLLGGYSGFGPLAPGVTRFPATSPHLRGVPEYNPTTLVLHWTPQFHTLRRLDVLGPFLADRLGSGHEAHEVGGAEVGSPVQPTDESYELRPLSWASHATLRSS